MTESMTKERTEEFQRVWKEKTKPIVKQIIELCDYYIPCPTDITYSMIAMRNQVIGRLIDELRAELKQRDEDYEAIRKAMKNDN
jgi:hypothetical protein